jgi:hypothetical protein
MMTLTALGLSGDPVHEPVHASYPNVLFFVTVRNFTKASHPLVSGAPPAGTGSTMRQGRGHPARGTVAGRMPVGADPLGQPGLPMALAMTRRLAFRSCARMT